MSKDTRFKPGNTASKGRTRGVRPSQIKEHRALLGPMVPEILAKCREMALGGDVSAMKLILDRALPIRSLAEEEFQEQLDELKTMLEERNVKEVSTQ